jgi:putative transposase|tara:strand:- start:54 stop:497 length:444 start_codon:yes stop_codon:yes gene_type:complete
VKRSIVVDGDGGPLGVVIAGANVHDTKLLAATLESMVLFPPPPLPGESQHLCLDKGYDNPTGHEAVSEYGYTDHIRRIGEEKFDENQEKRHPARRWVVERTLAWLSKYRAIQTRYEVKPENYAGLLKFACVLIWTRIWHRIKLDTTD